MPRTISREQETRVLVLLKGLGEHGDTLQAFSARLYPPSRPRRSGCRSVRGTSETRGRNSTAAQILLGLVQRGYAVQVGERFTRALFSLSDSGAAELAARFREGREQAAARGSAAAPRPHDVGPGVAFPGGPGEWAPR